MQHTITSAKRKQLQAIAKGKKPTETKRLNMEERLAYLADFRLYATAVCAAVTNHMTPSASNVHHDKAIEYWESIQGVPAKFEEIDRSRKAPGNDGNRHKAARYFRSVVSQYREVAETLTHISTDFNPAFGSRNLDVPARFRNFEKQPPVMLPQEIVVQFDKYLLVEARREYNRLKPFNPAGLNGK